MRWSRDGVTVQALGGALYIEERDYGLLLDTPVGVRAPRPGVLGTIALSGGRIGSVGGLVPLLCSLEPYRSEGVPLTLVGPLGDDRGAALASAWSRGWPGRYLVRHDALAPGQSFEAGPMVVDTVALLRGEPRWRPTPSVDRVTGLGFRVHTAAGVVAFLPGAAPTNAASRAVGDAVLAVVEVGTEPWPVDSQQWRFAVSDAAALDLEGELWAVDERGCLVGGEEN